MGSEGTQDGLIKLREGNGTSEGLGRNRAGIAREGLVASGGANGGVPATRQSW